MSNTGSPLLLRIPPGAIFLAVFVVGFALDAVFFGAPHLLMPDNFWFFAGLALLLVAGYFGLGGLGLFLVRRMPLTPGHAGAELATDGLYAFSRNPMYVGLALGHMALCLVLCLPLTAVLLPVSLGVMEFAVIPYEEDRLAARFGETFLAYRHRVRRWL